MGSQLHLIRLIPDPPAGADEGDGIRQTFLAQIPHARDRALLTRLSRRLYYLTARDAEHVLKHATYDRLQFQAVGRDLRFAAWVLSIVGRSDSEWKLAPIAARLSDEVAALADRIAAAAGR
jgi:hypothetical protein